jgi:hypothetical protein
MDTSISDFISHVRKGGTVSFSEAIAIIEQHYTYLPSKFVNGVGASQIINEAGTNEGSCKIFAFALMNGLTDDETLELFGDYYHKDVIEHPEGNDHANIRTFMKFGSKSIMYDQIALTPK